LIEFNSESVKLKYLLAAFIKLLLLLSISLSVSMLFIFLLERIFSFITGALSVSLVLMSFFIPSK